MARAHAVPDAQLRRLMQRMDALMYEHMHTELEPDTERARQAGAIADAAAALAGTADAIAEAPPDLALDESRRASFQTLANSLYTRAVELKDLASRGAYAELRESFARLDATCRSCHELFRDPRPFSTRP